jgi:hypothetical protein
LLHDFVELRVLPEVFLQDIVPNLESTVYIFLQLGDTEEFNTLDLFSWDAILYSGQLNYNFEVFIKSLNENTRLDVFRQYFISFCSWSLINILLLTASCW